MKPAGTAGRPTEMRTIEDIDRELELVAALRRAVLADGGRPSMAGVDELLDERSALAASIRP